MPKNKIKTKKTLRVKQRKAFVSPGLSLDEPAQCWAKLLNDPCNAPLCESPYPGQKGYMTRFSGVVTQSVGAGNTGVFFKVSPQGCFIAQGATASGATTFTPTNVSNTFPGYNFLFSNSNQVRCVAGCVQAWSSLSPLNITGNVHAGVVNTSAIDVAGQSLDALSQLAAASGKLTAEMVELKWRPGPVDEEYAPIGSGTFDLTDTNSVFYAFTGLSSSDVITFKVTFVYEWIPKANLGINQSPSKSVMTRFRVPNILAAMDRHMPEWWHGTMRALGKVHNAVELGKDLLKLV